MSIMRGALVIVVLLSMMLRRAEAQSVRSLVNGGNDLYDEKQYGEAEGKYRKAIEKEKGLPAGRFNLGNALYKQGKFDESLREYEDIAARPEAPAMRADAFYNHGNALMKSEQYREAVQSYTEALKLRPDDQDAKYNLSYALEKLKQQQQQQQKQDKNDKNQQKKDQQQQKNQEQKKEEQQQQQQQQKQEQQQQDQRQMAQQEKRMSKQDAERILDVLKNSERDVQKKLRVRQAARAKTDKDW